MHETLNLNDGNRRQTSRDTFVVLSLCIVTRSEFALIGKTTGTVLLNRAPGNYYLTPSVRHS